MRVARGGGQCFPYWHVVLNNTDAESFLIRCNGRRRCQRKMTSFRGQKLMRDVRREIRKTTLLRRQKSNKQKTKTKHKTRNKTKNKNDRINKWIGQFFILLMDGNKIALAYNKSGYWVCTATYTERYCTTKVAQPRHSELMHISQYSITCKYKPSVKQYPSCLLFHHHGYRTFKLVPGIHLRSYPKRFTLSESLKIFKWK